jgi:hypothetical protein
MRTWGRHPFESATKLAKREDFGLGFIAGAKVSARERGISVEDGEPKARG